MAENILKTRIQLKTGTIKEWNAIKDDTKKILKKGEVAVVEIPSETKTIVIGKDAEGKDITKDVQTAPTVLFKVGDDNSTFGALPWLSALAADVYDWAKTDWATFVANVQANAGLATAGQLDALTTRVKTLEDTIADINTALDAEFITEDEFTAFKETNTQAIAAAAQIGTDANNALTEYIEANDEAVDELNTAFTTFRDTTAPATYAAKSVETTKADKDSVYTKEEVYTKGETDNLVNGVKDLITGTNGLDARVDALEAFKDNTAATKTDVEDAKKALIGEGEVKSTDDTIKGAKAYADAAIDTFYNTYIENDSTALDTLKDVTEWLDANKDGAADIIADLNNKAAQDDLDEHTSKKDNPHEVTAAQVGAYTKGEVDAIIAPIPKTDTTYTFADGSEGKFTVTGTDGSSKEVNTGAKTYVDGIKDGFETRIQALEAVDHAHTSSLEDIEEAVANKHTHAANMVEVTPTQAESWTTGASTATTNAGDIDKLEARADAIESNYIRTAAKDTSKPDELTMYLGKSEITLVISGGSASEVW